MLNKVDSHIKRMLLSYPTLFKSRMDALSHQFLVNGNGYEWDDAGGLSSIGDPIRPLKMRFDDLDERQAELDRSIASDCHHSMAALFAARQAAIRREYSERLLIEAEVDLYATEHVMGENNKEDADWLRHYCPDYSAVQRAPLDRIDKEWALAAEEVLEAARLSLWRALAMYSEHFTRERADTSLLEKYDKTLTLMKRLDLVTGTSARTAKRAALTGRIIDEIIEEENHTCPTHGLN